MIEAITIALGFILLWMFAFLAAWLLSDDEPCDLDEHESQHMHDPFNKFNDKGGFQ